MTAFVMPSLGADMEDGKLVEWLVKPGDIVHKGDIVAVVETQKGAIEVEIFDEGTVSELCAAVGDTVPVGGILAQLRTEDEGRIPAARAPAPAASTQQPMVSPLPAVPKRPAPLPSPATVQPAERRKVSPAARRLAASLGLDPEQLTGTGLDGSVSLADVELARASGVKPGPAATTARRGGFDPADMRRAIAAAMSRSKREIPHYYLSSTVDMAVSLSWLSTFNAARTPAERMLPAVLMLKASALALRKVPQLNGFWQEGGFVPGKGIHIGWAISLRGGGLYAPAIRDVDSIALPDLMAKLRDLVQRVRTGGLRSSELTDSTVTVTSLGERGADSVTGVIYPPQVAILGFGRIKDRPWVMDGQIVSRPLVEVSLAGDHRASDGHAGGLVLSAIEQLLQEPEKL